METPIHYASVGLTLIFLAGVAALGLALGSVKIRRIGLGSTGVLFAGLIAGSVTAPIEPHTLRFVREFGLLLFVFTMGLQLGPGFFASLRAAGLAWNVLAVGIVTTGGGLVYLCGFLLQLEPGAIPGLFSGATTNTPSLGAVQQALQSNPQIPDVQRALPALAYSAVYSFGIFGIILSIVLLRRIWQIDLASEADQLRRQRRGNQLPLERRNVVVENPNLDGLPLARLPGLQEMEVSISRMLPSGESEAIMARETTVVHQGDVLLAVGSREHLENFVLIVCRLSERDLMQSANQVTFRRIVATRKKLLGKPLSELGLDHRLGVRITRVVRSGVEMPATGRHRIQFGDFLQVVGAPPNLDAAERELGNSMQELNATHFIPVFLGLTLGVMLGMAPLAMPGLSSPLRLGLAGGPLVAAIILGRVGRIGPLVWHMPTNTNLAFRELGIVLFLAAVGLGAGPRFFAVAFSFTGLIWAGCALVVSMTPLLLAGWIARRFLKMNFLSITGLLSGSMTDPPALAFAGALTQSDEPALAYATVYPVAMLSRIVVAQLLVLFLFR